MEKVLGLDEELKTAEAMEQQPVVCQDIFGEVFTAGSRPQACVRFEKSPLGVWIRKLLEETGEVIEAAAAYEADARLKGEPDMELRGLLGQELADVVTVCYSMFHAYGFSPREVEALFLLTNVKNGRRGYFRKAAGNEKV